MQTDKQKTDKQAQKNTNRKTDKTRAGKKQIYDSVVTFFHAEEQMYQKILL